LQAGLQFTGIQPCSALSASLHDIVGTQPIQRATPMILGAVKQVHNRASRIA
jgi:hypothetical protein